MSITSKTRGGITDASFKQVLRQSYQPQKIRQATCIHVRVIREQDEVSSERSGVGNIIAFYHNSRTGGGNFRTIAHQRRKASRGADGGGVCRIEIMVDAGLERGIACNGALKCYPTGRRCRDTTWKGIRFKEQLELASDEKDKREQCQQQRRRREHHG